MGSRVRRHIGNNIVGYVALFIALTGSAYAATAARNSVTSKSIKKGGVKSVDVKNNNLKSVDVKNNNLTGADVRESTLQQVPNANVANTANIANSANAAGNAETLDNLDSSALERRGEVVYGVANPINASVEYFSIPEMGLRVETDPDQGTADDDVTLRNISASRTLEVLQPGGSGSIAPGATQTLAAPIPTDSLQQIEVFVQDTTAGDPAAAQHRLFLHCYFWAGGSQLIRDDCVGIRLTP